MDIDSPFNPASPQAASINNLFVLSLIISAVIFVLVAGLVLYIAFRYRQRAGASEPRQVAGHTRLEIAWTIAPAVLLVAVFIPALTTMFAIDPPVGDQQPDLIVTGYQWWWEVRYPNSGVVTANEIHIPVGQRLLFRLEATDVIHSFWVPRLGPKRDMTPGHPTYLWLQADAPGTYQGACSEYCGDQHAWMRIRVIAQPQAEFDSWQRQQQQATTAPTGEPALRGAQLFQQLTCVNCHAIAGTAADARAGPNLTHLAGRQTLAAGRLENTPENLAAWIADPHSFKPGVLMPGYQLSESDLRALVAYLESLR